MVRKTLLKKAVSSFAAIAIAAAAMPAIPAFAETGATTYSFNGYDVEYSVKNEWIGGKTIEVKITNTGDEPILNWAFKYDAGGKVNDLWNAAVYNSDNTSYIMKNDGWNYEIAPAESVLFGYKLTDFGEKSPDSFVLCSKRVDKTEGYDVQYNITKEWDDGLQGEIVISNTSDEPLEAWELSFDNTFEINNLWDGRIISAADGRYVIASEMWSNPIDVGGSKTIGFTGTKQAVDATALNNFSLSVIVIDDDGNNSGTGGNTGNDDPNPNPDIDVTTDTDSDKIPDAYEEIFGTDKNNPDTDDDGLTDYEEIALTGTDPFVYDSVTEGISDADADCDGDGLTNKEELTMGTDPTQVDTDNDRINDYDENKVWYTDPLEADTDNDGIVDGDEVKIGLDPTNPETFGYPDIEYKSTQHISEDSISLSSINNENNDVFTYSVDVTSNGYVEPYMYARESSYTSVMKNDFMIGIAPELVYLGKYDIDNIKVSFSISDEYIEKTKSPEESKEDFLSRITIFRYFESANALLPVETNRDVETGIISTESDDITTYCLVNMDAWINMLKEYYDENVEKAEDPVSLQLKSSKSLAVPSSSKDIKSTKINNSIRIIFVLQSAGQSKEYFEKEKITIDQLALMLYSNYSDVKIALLEYKEYTYSENIKFYNYYNDFNTALKSISYTICNANCERGWVFSQIKKCDEFQESLNKFVMHFANGDSYNSFIGGNHIDDCGEYTNVSEFIPKGYSYTYGESRIKEAINKHNGLNLYYDSIDTNQLYEHIESHLKVPEAKFKALVPNGWKVIELESPLVPGGSTDTDYDTLSDWDEVNHDLLKWDTTGHVQQISVEDFMEEVSKLSLNSIYYDYSSIYVWFKDLTCIPLVSDPTDPDGDGDGIADKDEFSGSVVNDPRYDSVSPLKADNLETLYPELSLYFENGKNNASNPVYLTINKNNIVINVKIMYGTSDRKIGEIEIKRLRSAFNAGVKDYWSCQVDGQKYDFYPGMKITTEINLIDASNWNSTIDVIFSNLGARMINNSYVKTDDIFLLAGGKWTTNNHKTINICVNDYNEGNINIFKKTCAHEFGHVLGIGDAYGNDNTNNGYQISSNINLPDDENEFCNWELMRDSPDQNGNINLTSNEVEMFLQAFVDNDCQYFVEAECTFWWRYVDQKLSKAIKMPVLTYEKYIKKNKNYEYYYWDRSYIRDSFGNLKPNYVHFRTGNRFPDGWAY